MRIVSKRPSDRARSAGGALSVLPVIFRWRGRALSFAAQIAEIAQQRGEKVQIAKTCRRFGRR